MNSKLRQWAVVAGLAVGQFLSSRAEASAVSAPEAGWVSLFDGKTLAGWQANENPSTFWVEDGAIVVRGDRSHLFYTGAVEAHDFKNFEFSAEVMTSPGANSGIDFHTRWQDKGWPKNGFEVQVNNTHKNKNRTGSLYEAQDNPTAPVADGEWFTLFIRVEGKRARIFVNGKVISDFTEPADWKPPVKFEGRRFSHGTFALQGHDPESETRFRALMVRVLP